MRIVYIGTVNFSFTILEHLIALNVVEIVGIVTRKNSSFNSDFKSLQPIAERLGIPCLLADGIDQAEMAAWIKALSPDVVYCFGWSNLLKKEVLQIPRLGVIGYHPAALPQNRGRHPIIWSLVLGLKETASTFFFMDEGADSGDIISQEFIRIKDCDDASTLYEKLMEVSKKQVGKLTLELKNGTFRKIPQDHDRANYWRKRNKEDGKIDWRMSADTIHNLVRALTRPYVGAHCLYKGNEIKVWKTEMTDLQFDNIEPGKILKIEDGHIFVKCGKGVIKVLEHEFYPLPLEGEYI